MKSYQEQLQEVWIDIEIERNRLWSISQRKEYPYDDFLIWSGMCNFLHNHPRPLGQLYEKADKIIRKMRRFYN